MTWKGAVKALMKFTCWKLVCHYFTKRNLFRPERKKNSLLAAKKRPNTTGGSRIKKKIHFTRRGK
jgi:hypothetical protein